MLVVKLPYHVPQVCNVVDLRWVSHKGMCLVNLECLVREGKQTSAQRKRENEKTVEQIIRGGKKSFDFKKK